MNGCLAANVTHSSHHSRSILILIEIQSLNLGLFSDSVEILTKEKCFSSFASMNIKTEEIFVALKHNI